VSSTAGSLSDCSSEGSRTANATILGEQQKRKALQLLEEYKRAGLTVFNQGRTYPVKEFAELRMEAIPEIRGLLERFLSGGVNLIEFKEAHEELCRRHDYWGFKGFSGQMVLNQLTNWSKASVEMTNLLKTSLTVPADRDQAAQKIDSLHNKVGRLIPAGKSLRRASLPYLVSYFWQLQNPKGIPVQYGSTKRTLVETGILFDQEDPGTYFAQFWNSLDVLASLFAAHVEMAELNPYWFVEHVFWFHRERLKDLESPEPKTSKTRVRTEAAGYMRYVPPVVQQFVECSLGEGSSLDFERQVIELFRMLGFQVDELGQGKGREPDGIAYCREYNYAILFDAKSSKSGYTIGTDDRTMIEYIRRNERELRKEGYSNLYYVVVSSSFKGTSKPSIDRVRAETGIKSLVLVTSKQALRLLSARIENPYVFDLERFGSLLLDSGELAEESVEEFLEPAG